MTLLIDVGNSAVKWAQLQHNGELTPAQWQLHRGVPDIAARLIERWRSDVPRGAPIIACNVGGAQVAAAVESATQTLDLRTVKWLHTQPRFSGAISLINGYRQPMQLGVDRWHCMLGACSTVNGDIVVINAGTATTVDCVKANVEQARRFIGGVIAPGVRLMLESLAGETADLPAVSPATGGVAVDFPDNTDAAIATGVLDAQAGLVHQVWQRFAERLNANPHLVLTGGNAAALQARLPITPATIEDNLVLRGLALRARAEPE
ncbi:MAG: type III pantothenate kinase [Burkholderiaceae bacterium]